MSVETEKEEVKPIDLLLVDDDDELREDMARFFARRGYHVSESADGEQALVLADQRAFDVMVLDMMMPGISGIELLKSIKQHGAEAEVVMLTGKGTIESAVEAMKLGAREFLTKPVSLKDLDRLVRKCVESGQLRKENERLKAVIRHQRGTINIVGESPKMIEVFRLIERTAGSRSPILIQGESGTGKELVAKAFTRTARSATSRLS